MPKINIKRIGVVTKPQSALAHQAVIKVIEWGKRRGVEISLDRAAAKAVTEFSTEGLDHPMLLSSIDALLILGGDGTFLGAARMATAYNIPLLGVNLGSLGFMTEVALEELDTALDEMYEGQYDTEERMMLDLKIENAQGIRREVALNEIVFSGGYAAKMVELTVSVNTQHVTTYRADGLIISTPTDLPAFHRAYGAHRFDTQDTGRGLMSREQLLQGATGLIGDWFPDAYHDDERRGWGIAFATAEEKAAYDPERRFKLAKLGAC